MMTFDQIAIICLLIAMLSIYALERFRIEVVAMSGLAAGFALGLVPLQNVFVGFSSPAVITVVEILLIVSVLARTHVIDRFAGAIAARVESDYAILAVLCGTAALISVFMNNIGALALMFPVTLSVCARLDVAPTKVLMPLSFATLLGGLCSLTGTPANLIVNDWRIDQTGGAFDYFSMAQVGVPVAIAGLGWLVLSAPHIFRSVRNAGAQPLEIGPSEFLAEVELPAGSTWTGLRLPEAERKAEIQIHGVVRDGRHVFARRAEIELAVGDRLLAEMELEQLDVLRASGEIVPAAAPLEIAEGERIEAVVMPDSIVLGSRIETLRSFSERGVGMLALASRRRRIEGSFADLQLGVGDVLVLTAIEPRSGRLSQRRECCPCRFGRRQKGVRARCPASPSLSPASS